MIGLLGNVVFSASAFRVFTFDGMTKEISVRTAEHEIIGQKPVVEFIGPDLDTIDFNMRLDATLGVSPQKEIDNLEYLCKNGVICPFILGEKVHGDFLIMKVSQSFDHVYRDGALFKATIAVTIKEYN